MTRLTRTATGYATSDGRWTVEPVVMNDSPRSKGHRAWHVTDTTGQARLGAYSGRPSRTVDRLYEARDLIEAHMKQEES